MKKSNETDAADIATWLARETGHPTGDEEVATEGGYDESKGIGLPQAKHEEMRRFFDGLEVERALKEKRSASALEAVDEADEMNKALKNSIPPGGGY